MRLRTCIGCLEKKPKEKLIRLVLKDNQVVTDLTNRETGRGGYLCQGEQGVSTTCFQLAKEKNGIKKAFKTNIKKISFATSGPNCQTASGGHPRPH